MNFLSIFVLIPLLMLLGLWLSRNIAQIRAVMVAGASALLVAAVGLTVVYLQARHSGATDEMLFRADVAWYPALNIHYSVGVDGISVAMLLLSAIIVFTGTFASWRLQPLTKEYFLWFTLLSMGVFGFFISTDLFTMFMFYEVALIPMYLLIGVWGSGRKEYAAMKLTLMLMGGSAFLLIGILGIYFGSGATTMNLLEIAQLHNIPVEQQRIWFPLTFLGFGVLGALFPFHTWSPDGHASAPTAVSMLHAGVLMKLGGYGCFRIAMYLMPEAAQELGWIFLVLTGISVVYGAFIGNSSLGQLSGMVNMAVTWARLFLLAPFPKLPYISVPTHAGTKDCFLIVMTLILRCSRPFLTSSVPSSFSLFSKRSRCIWICPCPTPFTTSNFVSNVCVATPLSIQETVAASASVMALSFFPLMV